MTAKEYLQTIFNLKRRIARLEEARRDLVNDLYCFSSPAPDHEPVQTSPNGDRIIEVIAKKDEAEQKMVTEIRRLIDVKMKIIADIERVPNERQKQILFDRYVMCKRWERIAAEHDKGIRWVYRLHGRALKSFEERWSGDH